MTINEYCRNYRISVGATLADIEGSQKIAALSAFENGRSGSLRQFDKYLDFAVRSGDGLTFCRGLAATQRGKAK